MKVQILLEVHHRSTFLRMPRAKAKGRCHCRCSGAHVGMRLAHHQLVDAVATGHRLRLTGRVQWKIIVELSTGTSVVQGMTGPLPHLLLLLLLGLLLLCLLQALHKITVRFAQLVSFDVFDHLAHLIGRVGHGIVQGFKVVLSDLFDPGFNVEQTILDVHYAISIGFLQQSPLLLVVRHTPIVGFSALGQTIGGVLLGATFLLQRFVVDGHGITAQKSKS